MLPTYLTHSIVGHLQAGYQVHLTYQVYATIMIYVCITAYLLTPLMS